MRFGAHAAPPARPRCLKGADAQMAEVTAHRAPSRSKRPLAVGESQRRLLVERVSGVGEFDGPSGPVDEFHS